MAPGSATLPVLDEKTKVIEKPEEEEERETWDKKIDFLLSVIGFAVDLGNVWRFPYICYRNGGGAFLLPYLIMLVFAGFPLFYMELALGQYQRCGCLTVWKRICPMLKGIGIAICIIATYVGWYYNTIIAWSVFYFFSSMKKDVPWKSCSKEWGTVNCTELSERRQYFLQNHTEKNYTTPNEEFFERHVLGLTDENSIDNLGPVKWDIALCLLAVFTIVYFAMWKGVKSSGKAVWVTATMPYLVLTILLIRGCTLEGAYDGIKYFIVPRFDALGNFGVWVDAAAQIFFSLGPGFGVLLALSSYNKFTNNCFRDAVLTSSVNCFTSFLAGFAVFSVLGHMARMQGTDVENVARDDVGLIFIVYPEAIANLQLSSLWAVIFFFMLITLGLDTTFTLTVALFKLAIMTDYSIELSKNTQIQFGGLEAIATGILDEWPKLRKKREIFIFFLMMYCFLGALATTTHGGIYLVQLMDTYGAPISIIFVVFLEAIAISWIYGVERFQRDIETMLGPQSRIYWIILTVLWKFVSPAFLLVLFILSLIAGNEPKYENYKYPSWSIAVGWLMVCSSLICIPGYIVFKFIRTPGTPIERFNTMMIPEEVPKHTEDCMPVSV